MCGICGSVLYSFGQLPDVDRLRIARDYMSARGPDGSSEWLSRSRKVWLGHRRLSVIELSDLGSQPMLSHDGRLAVTFNGEIYNYRSLRHELIQAGHRFRTHSDTEVLLELYRKLGPAMVPRLRGMFAFALWDDETRQLLLARDPYGIKPLYYTDDGGKITFASSVKALVSSGLADASIEAAGLAGFFLLGSVPEPWTLYSSIKSLPAGSTLLVSGSQLGSPRRYHSVASIWRDAERGMVRQSSVIAQEVIRAALLDTVKHHLVADVPVGAFLSAGVDSGALVGLMRDAGQSKIDTITLTFDTFQGTINDEAPLAARVARHYGVRHHLRSVSTVEFAEDLPRILAAMDQPSVDGVNTWFAAKAAREIGLKVAISGVGGDELFGGYDTFQRLRILTDWLWLPSRIPGLPRLSKWAFNTMRSFGVSLHPKTSDVLALSNSLARAYLLQRGLYLPSEAKDAWKERAFIEGGLAKLDLEGLVKSEVSPGPSSWFAQVATLEASIYLRNQLLRDTDWASMAHSLEVRTPLVDSLLLERVAPVILANNQYVGKRLLSRAPIKPLPDEIANRAKTGFGVPVESWVRDMLPTYRQSRSQRNPEPFSRFWARQVASKQTDISSLFVSGKVRHDEL